MHKSFYKLDCEPFDLHPDPTFLWMGEKYKEALSVLRYGILDNKGFLLLIGESGIGKTVLLRTLTESLPPDVLWAIVANPDVPKMEMFNAIAKGFGMGKEYNSKVEFMLDFGTFLQERHDENKKMLLIVDSAHLLTQENLEELRLLSNIEKADAKLLHIFFSAQPAFGAILTRPRNSAMRQRLSLTHTIEPLTAQETSEYIEHRFSVAGVENRILTEKAIRSVHHFSGGIPKKINVICQQVLIEGAKQGRRVIDQGAVQECMQKFARSSDPNRMDFAAGSMQSGGEEKKPRAFLFGIGALALLALIVGSGYFFWSQRSGNSRSVSQSPAAINEPSVNAASPSSASATGNRGTTEKAVDRPPSSAKTDAPAADTPVNVINRIAARPVAPVAPPASTAPNGQESSQEQASTVTISPATGLATVRPTTGTTTGGAVVKAAAAPDADTRTAPEGNGQQQASDNGEEIIIDSRHGETPPAKTNADATPSPTQKSPTQKTSQAAPPAVSTSTPSAATTPAPATPSVATAPASPPVVTTPATATPAATTTSTTTTSTTAKPLPQVKAILPLRGNTRALTDEGQAALADFVRKFKEIGKGRIEVRGYVSSTSNSKENIQFSIRRAEAVQAMLIRAGVEQKSIIVRGMGIQDPLASNDTAEGRDKNRRVELEIIP